MSFNNVRSLGNGITEIIGSTEAAVSANIFVKRGSIAAIEHRTRYREIRLDIVGKQVPILLRYVLDTEGEQMIQGLLDCMKDVPDAVEKELEQIKVKEVSARLKIDLMKDQMGELRLLLEQIASNTLVRSEPLPDLEEVDADVVESEGPKALSDYDSLSECEDTRAAELARCSDLVIFCATAFLIAILLTSVYTISVRTGHRFL